MTAMREPSAEEIKTARALTAAIATPPLLLPEQATSIIAQALVTAAEQARAEGAAERARLAERVTELEGGLFGSARLYGFECPDGLPCWCEPEERSGPHSERCGDLRALLTGAADA